MINVYVMNLGRYNEGHIDGGYLELPAKTEDVQSLLRQIHVDGIRYGDIAITECESDIPGLAEKLIKYGGLDEINYLAALIGEMGGYDLDTFIAAVAYDEFTDSMAELINLTQNLGFYEYLPGIEDAEEYGRYCIDEYGYLPENFKRYFDYSEFGHDLAEEDGRFLHGGYIRETWDCPFREHYKSTDDIPDEYRIFAYPENDSIRDTLSQYQKIVAESMPTGKGHRPQAVEH